MASCAEFLSTAAGEEATAAVSLDNVTKRFGRLRALENLTLELRAGEILGLLGPNGAGKTTALHLILGLLASSAGSVRVWGLQPRSWRFRPCRRFIGYLPGDLAFDDNERGDRLIDLFAKLSNAPTLCREQLCDRLGLERSDLRRPVRFYSRGMKQKLGIVAALQHLPRLIILDEPTNALDPVAQQVFYAILRERARDGAAILFSTHVLHEALEICDRIVLLSEGHLVETFATGKLLAQAPRHLYLRLSADALSRLTAPPHLPLAEFLERRHDGWFVYQIDPGGIVPALRELTHLPVVDVRIESAAIDHLLSIYRIKRRP